MFDFVYPPTARWRNRWERLASFHHQVPTRIDRDFAISGQDMAAIVRLASGRSRNVRLANRWQSSFGPVISPDIAVTRPQRSRITTRYTIPAPLRAPTDIGLGWLNGRLMSGFGQAKAAGLLSACLISGASAPAAIPLGERRGPTLDDLVGTLGL